MLKWLNGDVESKGRIGITAGAFDLLHAGHAAMLADAKQVCDYLIVALQNDPSIDRPEKINLFNLSLEDNYNYQQRDL